LTSCAAREVERAIDVVWCKKKGLGVFLTAMRNSNVMRYAREIEHDDRTAAEYGGAPACPDLRPPRLRRHARRLFWEVTSEKE